MTSNLAQRDPRFTLARRKHKIREIPKDRPTPLADLQLGKATASVSFRNDECLWGALGQQKAAILRFRAGRQEPSGYKLRNMTVKLSFEETSPDVIASIETTPNVFLLERPAPEYITGGVKTRSQEKSFTVNPSVPTPIGNIAVGSYEKKSKSEEEEAWTFTSQWESDGQQSYKAAVWEWSANAANTQLEDIGDLYGGVVLGHADQPFYIRCNLEGRLVSNFNGNWSGRRWYWFKSVDKDNGDSVIHRIVPTSGAQDDLEKDAKELDKILQALCEKSHSHPRK